MVKPNSIMECAGLQEKKKTFLKLINERRTKKMAEWLEAQVIVAANKMNMPIITFGICLLLFNTNISPKLVHS